MVILETAITKDGTLSVVERDNMLALRNGDSGYSCIYTDNSTYQPIYVPVQYLFEDFACKKNIGRVAILGGGCCSFPRFIIKRYNNTIFVDSIEYLPLIIDYTKKYFLKGIETNKLNIIKDDAFHFIERTTNKYDFIFVDLFVGGISIRQSHTRNFLINLSKHTGKHSIVVFNEYQKTLQQCKNLCTMGIDYFDKSIILKDEENTYYVAFINGEYDEYGIKQYLL